MSTASRDARQSEQRASRAIVLFSALLAVAVVAVVSSAPLSMLSAAGLPVPPTALNPARWNGPSATVRTLPAGVSAGGVDSPDDIAALALPVLGFRGTVRLLIELDPESERLTGAAVVGIDGRAKYPYRYPLMTQLLESAPEHSTGAATRLGAGLMLLAGEPRDEQGALYYNAAPAAYAILDEARADGDCTAQLNLLQLVTADQFPEDGVVTREFRRAQRMCPDDPTPLWLLSQFHAQRAATLDPAGHSTDPLRVDKRTVIGTASQLVEQFPGSPDAHTALGDAHLRLGLRLSEKSPFTARQHFRLAALEYRSRRSEASVSGLARALMGLNQFDEAADLLAAELDRWSHPGPALELLIRAQEDAKDFGDASDTARRLSGLGTSAYPQGDALFAVPGGDDVFDGGGPLSLGAGTATPFTVELHPSPDGFGGGATVAVSPIPLYRDSELTRTEADCPDWVWRRDALLADDPARAMEDFPRSDSLAEVFRSVRPGQTPCGPWKYERTLFEDIAALEMGKEVAKGRDYLADTADERQNLWRWAGRLDKAEAALEDGRSAADGGLYELRLGEVQFLQEDFDAAALMFGTAAEQIQFDTWNNDLGRDEALLGRGVALLAAGRRNDGRDLLRSVSEDASRGAAFHQQAEEGSTVTAQEFAVVSYQSLMQLADDSLAHQNCEAAIEDYASAQALIPSVSSPFPVPDTIRFDALYGNRAVAELLCDRYSDARLSIATALRQDPQSPVFLMTAAYVAHLQGDAETAIRHNAAAAEVDPGAFPVLNDLGVLLARSGREAEAIRALRRAVGANPDYALGWFNLGVLYSRMGVSHFLESQGALAKAFQLDSSLEQRERQLIIDTRIYHTELDISRPLPPNWSLAELERRQPLAPLGLLAALTLAVGLTRGFGKEIAGDSQDAWLERFEKIPVMVRLRRLLRSPVWAIGATVVALAIPAFLHPSVGSTFVFAVVLSLLVLSFLVVQLRSTAAISQRTSAAQAAWPPSLVFGLIAPMFSLAWAPLPVTDSAKLPRRVYAVAPLSLGVLSGILFLETAVWGVPFTQTVAGVTLVMAASVLVPLGPLDGNRLGKAGGVAALGLIGFAGLWFIGLA